MLVDVQHNTAESIAEALDARLARFLGPDGQDGVVDPNVALAPLTARLDALPHAIAEEITKAALSTAFEPPQGLPPEVTGAVGGLTKASNLKTAELRNAIGQGLLGPYGALLQQFMPPLYDYLTENPDMVVQALEMPVVQKLIQKASAMAGQAAQASGWGT